MPLQGLEALRGTAVSFAATLNNNTPGTPTAPTGATDDEFDLWAPLEKVKGFGIIVAVLFVVTLCLTRIQFSSATKTLLRFVVFTSLHLADYVTNVMTMVIVYTCHHEKYLLILAPVHFTIGLFCLYTAATGIDWQNWSCPPVLKFIFMVIVMGLMQGVQVKLAHDDFREQRALHARSEEDSEMAVPSMMPGRFNLKAMDGVLEGTVFAFMAMYALLKNRWGIEYDGFVLEQWQETMLYASAFFSFFTIGLALMEVDYRTSAAVQRMLNPSNLAQVRHLLFRSSEVATRLLTVLVFCTFMRPTAYWQLTFVVLGADYLFGLILLVCLGGRDPIREAALLLAVPLFMVNVMQFVDTPGMSLQAQRISSILAPLRTLEMIGVLAFCYYGMTEVQLNHEQGQTSLLMWKFLWQDHTEWVVSWALFAFIYYTLLLTYAKRMKPEADLHLAVANNDVDCLRTLLTESELVLDINRYGPDGRTPLHLAAVRSKVECMRMLVEQRANIHSRTGDQKKNTALHLAVMNKDAAAARYLCLLCGTDGQFLNATNHDGDTALHVAARRQNVGGLKELLGQRLVDLKIRNKGGQTAADCAPSDKFGFDRDSSECAITEIFRDAEAGRRPAAGPMSGCELSPMTSATSVSVEDGAASSSSSSAPLAAGPSMPTGEDNSQAAQLAAAAEAADSQNHVPLLNIDSQAEEEFMKRRGSSMSASASVKGRDLAPVTNCGISSFMLSAGLGALSRAFLNTIREDEGEEGGGASQVQARFDDFIEIKPIGEGAFGKVILVRHRESNELFAMKLMDKAKFKAQKITSKAVSEQYILKTTRHPFIVQLMYAFQGSTYWALVMELCPNGDLQDELVKKGKPGMELRECARLGGEVLLGVEHLHRISVIFRDLKLENVVLDPLNRAKLTDFGLAKKLYSANDARTMCGSYGYAAPEIIDPLLNKGRYTYAVDLYSYGVMMYMLLSGGEQAHNNPKQRLPPIRHSSLRRKLKAEGEKDPRSPWATVKVGAHELLIQLTHEDPKTRTTSTLIKEHRFFTDLLGHPVDELLAIAIAADEEKARGLVAAAPAPIAEGDEEAPRASVTKY